MTDSERAVRLAVIGWGLVIVYAGAVLVGPEGLKGASVFFAVAVILGAWVWLRRSRPALAVSLVVGVLFTVEQAAYVVGDTSPLELGRLVADLIGLVAGVVVVTGSVLALRARRREPVAVA